MRSAAHEDISPFKHKKMKRNRKIRVLLTLYIRKAVAYTEFTGIGSETGN